LLLSPSRRCDGFFAASTITVDNETEVGFGSINLTHQGDESYGNMWQKTRSILHYFYDHYLDDYDYFYNMGDDTLPIMENVRNYLHSLEQSMNVTGKNNSIPLYIGQTIPKGRFTFAGGGAGYLLNRAALKTYVEKLGDCLGGAVISAEDRFLGSCFNNIGIKVTDTADAQGRQRFNGLDPKAHGTPSVPGRYFYPVFDYWGKKQGHGFKVGKDLISSQTTTFHLFRTPVMMKRTHAILYRSCPRGTLLGDALSERDAKTAHLIDHPQILSSESTGESSGAPDTKQGQREPPANSNSKHNATRAPTGTQNHTTSDSSDPDGAKTKPNSIPLATSTDESTPKDPTTDNPAISSALNTGTGTQNQTRDHPHAGALYPDGTWGYVADVTRVRRMMLQRFQKERQRYNASLLSFLSFNNSEEFEQVCNVAPGAGIEGAEGYAMLINRVIVNGPDPEPSNMSNTSMIHLSTAPRPMSENRPARGPRILCAVYTHAGAIARMEGIADTWGW
jgi:hypothetical protein